jgi:hypothetical protein
MRVLEVAELILSNDFRAKPPELRDAMVRIAGASAAACWVDARAAAAAVNGIRPA